EIIHYPGNAVRRTLTRI
ncbi:conserved hypothetical protein, partial [Trichinella spiralis]